MKAIKESKILCKLLGVSKQMEKWSFNFCAVVSAIKVKLQKILRWSICCINTQVVQCFDWYFFVTSASQVNVLYASEGILISGKTIIRLDVKNIVQVWI